MATRPASRKIKPEDDNLKNVLSLPSHAKRKELSMIKFDEKWLSNPENELLYCDKDSVVELYIRLPDTFPEFYRYLSNRSQRPGLWLWPTRWSNSELLIEYYDDTVHNYGNLDGENWLNYSQDLISLLSSKIQSSYLLRSPRSRIRITKVGADYSLSVEKRLYDQHIYSKLDFSELLTSVYAPSDEMLKSSILPIGSKAKKEKPLAKWLISSKTTFHPRTIVEASLAPFIQFDSSKKQQNFIEAEYSFICLLTEADALEELKYVGCESQIFDKPYECLSEVVKAADQKIIIIVSQSLSRHFVPLIHDLIQVIYIYILRKYESYHENEDDNYVNDKRYPKIRGSFIEQTMLISKLNDDLKHLSNIPLRQPILTDPLKTNTSRDFYVISKKPSSLKSLTGEEQDFVSFQLIIKAIVEFDSTNPLNNITASVKLCKIFPNKNEAKLLWETNDKFRQKYVSKTAINFYLTDKLLKNELNNCLCSKNIRNICKLWFFIRDVLKQLPYGKKSITVYRGQYITTDQLQMLKNNIGNYMTFTKFCSMSTSNIRAMRRSGEDHSHPQLNSVVFQLEISNGNTSTRFSMVQQSYEELIFLLAAGSVFCIESVEKLNDQVWCCKLRINSDDESKLTRMFQHYETEIGTPLTYLSLGVYLNEMGKEDIAVQYYGNLLAVATDSDITSSIYNNLAIIYERRKNITMAQIFWEEASKTQKVDTLKASTPLFEQKTDVVVADPALDTSAIINYYNLACVYQQAGYFDEALEACEKALKLSTIAPDPTNIVLVHSAMGSVYFSQKNYENALKSFQMALDIALIHLSATDPLIDQYLNNIRLLKNIINEKQS